VVLDQPDVWEENLLAYQAFWDLTSERNTGFGEGVIPFPAIRSYAHELEIPVLELLRILRGMDKAYLKFRKAEEEKRTKDAERNQRRGNRARVHR
jgi:hypothetical protein